MWCNSIFGYPTALDGSNLFVKNQQADVLWIAGCHVYVAGNFVNKKTMCVYLKKRTKAMSRK